MNPDPFDILGLPAGFEITTAQIERAYLAHAALLHPDALAEEAESGGRTAELNHAREVLLNAESRAGAMLARLGGPSKEVDKGLPAGFLAEFMDVRAEAEVALAGGDPGERAKWRAWGLNRRAEHERSIAAQFGALSNSPSPSSLSAIRRELNAWRYVERFLEQLDSPGAADTRATGAG